MSETRKSFCRICAAYCGYELTVEAGRITRLRGDRSDPLSLGYACFKGLRSVEFYHHEQRLKRPLVRRGDALVEATSDDALNEAGARLKQIVAEHGPASVGFYIGTQAYFAALSPPFIDAFAKALGTPKVFTTMTIDQSAKWVAPARMDDWKAGSLPFEEADVWLFAGSNPMTTMVAAGGPNYFSFSHPVEKMQRAKARGMKLIVIDPRESETAALADLHLRIVPGRDVEVAAALLHVVLREGWHDSAFCADYVADLPALRQAVRHFSPETVAALAGVSASQIVAAAATFARDHRRGMVGTGTGPDMARHSNTAEHLYQALNVVCGRFPRAGDRVANPGVLRPQLEPTADVVPANREWETSPKTAAQGLGTIRSQMMTAEISNDILHTGADRLRALIVVGGNPQVALPDQARAERALAGLDLLVVIDPVLTGTARLADYVIAPTLPYERADHTLYLERNFQRPFSHYTGAIVPPPEGSDVVEDWYALWRIAEAAGVKLQIAQAPVDAEGPPTSEALLARLVAKGRVPLQQVIAAGQGAVFELDARIGARQTDARFQVMPADLAAELRQVEAENGAGSVAAPAGDHEFYVTVRRHKDTMNSTGTAFPSVRKRFGANPVYMHPADMQRLTITEGDAVCVSRDAHELGGRVRADDALRPGTVAVSHGWSGRGSHPLEATNRLVDADAGKASINHMPIMTGYIASVRKMAANGIQT